MEPKVRERLDALYQRKQFLPIGEQNGAIKQVKSLIANTKSNPEKLFIGEGIWICNLILRENTPVKSFIICEEYIKSNEIVDIIEKMAEKCDFLYVVSSKTFLKISERTNPDGILCVAKLPEQNLEKIKLSKNSVVLVLDGVEIPGNIGTMVRVADGAGVDAVFVCNRKARLSHPKLIKGSQGSVLTVPIYEFAEVKDCYEYLKRKKFTIYLADTRATLQYFEEPFNCNTALVMGSERYGITREWYDYEHKMISIPMKGKCDSLNVGVAATILVYEASVKNGRFN